MRLDQVSPRVYANCDGETGGNVAIILMEDSVAAVDAARATQEEAVSHDGYPGFYGSPGDRRERSLRHWYSVWRMKMA